MLPMMITVMILSFGTDRSRQTGQTQIRLQRSLSGVQIFRMFTVTHFYLVDSLDISIWATAWQNQQNGLCAQRRLRSAWAYAQSDQSSLCAQWVAKDPRFLHADSEDSDQTGQMPRLIWTLIRLGGCPGWSESSVSVQVILLVLSCNGSIITFTEILVFYSGTEKEAIWW